MSTDYRLQKIREILSLLDLTDRECEVFFILLKNGTSTPANIAKQIRSIPRTSIYDILKTLQYHGLISHFNQGNTIYYQIENIEHIADNIEIQKRELNEKQNKIRSMADLFQQLKSGTVYKPKIRYFEDKQGIFAMHRELQNARKETRTIVDIASVCQTFPHTLTEDNLKDFQMYQILKKDLMIKTKEAERYLKVAPITPFHQVKWLPPEILFKTDTLIWEGHVAIIDYSDELSGIIIDNPTISATFVSWFEMMWNGIKNQT
jgi:sugar-specific transcriptional regulator TrmB